MAVFIQAFNITLGNEGGYANNPDDHGGETYAGIARNFWPHWPGWPFVDKAVASNTRDINASLAGNSEVQTQVQLFYKQNFWDAICLDQLTGQQLANQLFDTAVNMGAGIAARLLQQAINNIDPAQLTCDGVVGPKTIAAANRIQEIGLYNQFIALRKQRYMNIIAANPSQAQFQYAWFSRLTPFDPQLA